MKHQVVFFTKPTFSEEMRRAAKLITRIQKESVHNSKMLWVTENLQPSIRRSVGGWATLVCCAPSRDPSMVSNLGP